MFFKREHEDILEPSLQQNNTTNAREQTGLFPFNPLCKAWTTAIVTLSNITEKQKESQQPTVYYKVRAKQGLVNELTIEEKKAL